MTQPTRTRLRVTALLAMALWAAPGAGALGVGFHLAVGDHHSDHRHADDHRAVAVELALAAVHGHHHDLAATSDHEHPAPAGGAPSVVASAPAAAGPPPAGLLPRLADPRGPAPPPAHRGPPVPLYGTHCSLLL